MITCNIERLFLKYCPNYSNSSLTFSEKMAFVGAKIFIAMTEEKLKNQEFLDDLSVLFSFFMRNINKDGVLTQDSLDMLFAIIGMIYKIKNMPIQILIDAANLKKSKPSEPEDDKDVGC